MTRRAKPHDLTSAELAVMKALWSEGRLSAREVHERIAERLEWAYSTTRTTLDRMAGKGLVAKEEFHGLYLYSPLISRPAGLAGMIRDLADRVLDVDYAPVLSLFAEATELSDAEIEELERLLEER